MASRIGVLRGSLPSDFRSRRSGGTPGVFDGRERRAVGHTSMLGVPPDRYASFIRTNARGPHTRMTMAARKATMSPVIRAS